jgi:hypothetical protein
LNLASHAAHLKATVEIFGVVTDARVVPLPGSPADLELAEARRLARDDDSWGEDRVRTVYAAALMSYTAALDEALAMAAVMTGGTRTAIPAVVLARSLAEAASQAWWLLEPGTGARGRVERLQCLRLRSAIEGENAADADGIAEADWPQYTETQAQVFEYSRKLGLECPARSGHAYVCGGQRMPSASRRIETMLGDVGVEAVYNIHSGFAHCELFALWQGFERSADDQLCRPVISKDTVRGAVAVAARALYYPAARVTGLFGLAPPSGLDDWVDAHDTATQPLS